MASQAKRKRDKRLPSTAAPMCEAAMRISGCNYPVRMVEIVDGLTRNEMRDALMDLGIHVSAERLRERRIQRRRSRGA